METDLTKLRDRAARLRAEALALAGLVRGVLEPALGPVELAGSAVMDVMVWPDVDLYVRAEPGDGRRLLELVPPLAAALAEHGRPVARLSFRDEHLRRDPAFPGDPGLYLGVELTASGGAEWKLDLWGWDRTRFERQRERHLRLQRAIAGVDRDVLLRLKDRALALPGYRSMDVYAFVLAGAGSTFEEFERFRARTAAGSS